MNSNAEALVNEYQKLQDAIKKARLSKQQLLAQQHENKSVLAELNVLESDAVLYKLVGPVLVKQEVPEAVITVQKRLEYIQQEMDRSEKVTEETSKKIQEIATQIEGLQRQMMAAEQKPQVAA